MLIPGQTVQHIFYVRSRSLVVSPDATPTAAIVRNGITTAISVAVTALSDGGWLASATLPANWVTSDRVHLRMQAVKDALAIVDTVLLGQVDAGLGKLLAIAGLTPNISVSAQDSVSGQPGYRRTSDNAIRQTIVTNPDGTKTLGLE